MRKRIVSVGLVVCLIVSVLAVSGCFKREQSGAAQSEQNIEATETMAPGGLPVETVYADETTAPTDDADKSVEVKNEDMFCGVYITFSKLKSGKKYTAKFTGNMGENDVTFDFGSQVKGVSAFAAYPPAELSVTDVLFLQTDNAFDGAVSTKGENGKVNIDVNAAAYIRSGTTIYCNSVFQTADGEVYLTAAQSGKTVGANEVVVGSATTAFYGRESKERITTVNLKVENETYDKLIVIQQDKAGNNVMTDEITSGQFPECIEVAKKVKSIMVEQQKFDQTKNAYVTIRTDRYSKKELGSVLPVYFMGSNPYATSRLIEIIKE